MPDLAQPFPLTPLPRRSVVTGGAGLVLGLSTLRLPAAAAATSPDAATQSVTAPQTLAVDDTGLTLPDHDLTLRIAILSASGAPVTTAVALTLTVRLDDGSNAGAGSIVAGTSIDGEVRSTRTVTTSDGSVVVSVAFPASGTYLLLLTTDPALGAHPDGVTLLHQHTA